MLEKDHKLLARQGKKIGNALFSQNHTLDNNEILLVTEKGYQSDRRVLELKRGVSGEFKEIVVVPDWVISAIRAQRIT